MNPYLRTRSWSSFVFLLVKSIVSFTLSFMVALLVMLRSCSIMDNSSPMGPPIIIMSSVICGWGCIIIIIWGGGAIIGPLIMGGGPCCIPSIAQDCWNRLFLILIWLKRSVG